METDLIDLDLAPAEAELTKLLGNKLYGYYQAICQKIITSLSPDWDRWAKGGRRGKYYHGYFVTPKAIGIDMFLISDPDLKQLTCSIHVRKRMFQKILKQKEHFNKAGQETIESCLGLYEMYPSGYDLEFRIKKETEDRFQAMLQALEILGK